MVGELAHQEYATATTFAKVLGPSRVRKAVVIKASTFIGNPDGYTVFFFPRPYLNGLGFYLTIAMHDGIGHGLGEADEDVALLVWVKVVPVYQFFNERLYC